MKNKIEGGCGKDDNVSAFYDYIYTAHNAFARLWINVPQGHKITIISNQKVQDACKKNITQFAFPGKEVPIKKIEETRIEGYKWSYYFIPENKLSKTKLKFYWVNEFDWITKLDWIKEWKIDDSYIDVLVFENDKGAQIHTGLLTLS